MNEITKRLHIQSPPQMAYEAFVNEFNEWWPKEYTWSQDTLKEIRIDGKPGGLCTEIGPNGFRCDWGTVQKISAGEMIHMSWQIGPTREPVPNPAKASDIVIKFVQADTATTIFFSHFNFQKHSGDAEAYQKMMNSKQGWDYILNAYKSYCEKG